MRQRKETRNIDSGKIQVWKEDKKKRMKSNVYKGKITLNSTSWEMKLE